MTYNPEIHHRRSIRLKDYDYSQAGAYFVTICTKDKECLFGQIVDGEMIQSNAGKITEDVWRSLPERFQSVEMDASVVMPNHFHGIIVGAPLAAPCINAVVGINASPISILTEKGSCVSNQKGAASSAPTLGNVIRAFKSISAIAANRILGRQGAPVWQRNYYEHIIRDEPELNKIREYIINNPLNWKSDENYIN